MALNWKLGRDCSLSVAGYSLPLAKEVTVELGGNEADVTTRASAGVRRAALAARELTVSGTALYSPDDAAVQELIVAHHRGIPIAMVLSDPTLNYAGWWSVASLSLPQPLEDVVTMDFTLQPVSWSVDGGYFTTVAFDWVIDGGPLSAPEFAGTIDGGAFV